MAQDLRVGLLIKRLAEVEERLAKLEAKPVAKKKTK